MGSKRSFISNGFSVFSTASRGEYRSESSAIAEMRKNLLGHYSAGKSFHLDRKKMAGDQVKIAVDVQKAIAKEDIRIVLQSPLNARQSRCVKFARRARRVKTSTLTGSNT